MTKKNKYMKGQGLPEYALMLVFVAVVLLAALTNIGQTLSVTFGNIMAMFQFFSVFLNNKGTTKLFLRNPLSFR